MRVGQGWELCPVVAASRHVQTPVLSFHCIGLLWLAADDGFLLASL